MVKYQLSVTMGNHEATAEEIQRRYHEPASGVYQTAVQNLIDTVRQYEQTYGRDDHANVLLTYRINGREQKQWRWPQP